MAPGLMPSPLRLGERHLLLITLFRARWRHGLVPSPRRLGGHRLLLASLTGSERRGNSVDGTWPRAVTPSSWRTSSSARQNTPLSPSAPGGGDGSTRQVSSSTTHLVTGPTPSASMVENPAKAILVFRPMDGSLCSSVYFYLLLRVNTLHIYFVFRVSFLSVPMLTRRSAE